MLTGVDKSGNPEEILRESEKRLRLITESAPYAMILVDEQGKIVFTNLQTEKTFGYSKEELLGQSIEILVPAGSRGRHVQDRTNFNAHPSTRSMGVGRDLFGLRKDGTQVPVEIGLTPLTTSGGLRILASIVDITVRKRLEEEQRRLEREVLEATEVERKRIGQELHDSLGQQLLGIAFLSGALKERLHQKSLAEAVSADHISELIEKVLTQARELSRELYAAELDTHGLYEALKQLVVNVNSTTNIHCQFDCASFLTLDDKMKATNIYRIAQEALHNAQRHSMATEIILSATLSETEFKLVIKDNGIGISNPAKSDGMGLKTMRYRADIMGGALHVSSENNQGTLISCIVPLQAKGMGM